MFSPGPVQPNSRSWPPTVPGLSLKRGFMGKYDHLIPAILCMNSCKSADGCRLPNVPVYGHPHAHCKLAIPNALQEVYFLLGRLGFYFCMST